MPRSCCKPDELDEDRTHSVRYYQEFLQDGQVVTEDHGTGEIACTHNDAIALAETVAWRFGVGMKPRGRNGTWMGSEILEGDGERAHVWIDRGPGDIEYDEARAREEAEGD